MACARCATSRCVLSCDTPWIACFDYRAQNSTLSERRSHIFPPQNFFQEWLPQDDTLHAYELGLKRAGLEARRALTFQAEERSLPAQKECLALFLDCA